MGWAQLKKIGLKPKRREKAFLEKIRSDETKEKVLSLPVESFSERDIKEILVYGMYVKKNLAAFVPVSKERRLEKTLEWLENAIGEFIKHAR